MANLFLQKCFPEYHLRYVAAVCWHTLNLRGQTSFHPVCPPCLVPSISCQQSRGRQRRESSFQGSSYPTEKSRLMLIGTKSCSQREILSSTPSERNKGPAFDRTSRKSGLSELGVLAAIFLLVLMAIIVILLP